MHAKSLQLCPTLYNPMHYSMPGSPVHGILQAGILEWVAIPFSSDLSDPGIESGSSALQAYFFLPSEPPRKPYYVPADSNVYTFQFSLSGIIVSASF